MRFPGARDPAEFHDLAVTGRRMFQPVRALPGRPLRAAMIDDWAAPQITQGDWSSDALARAQPNLERAHLVPASLGQTDLEPGDLEPGDLGPVQKLATEMTALALTDAGLREAAGHSRTGMVIASTAPGLGDLVSSQLGFAARGPCLPAARTSSLHAVAAAAAALRADELGLRSPAWPSSAWLLATQVTRPVLFAQAMAQAAHTADLIVVAGPDAGLAGRAAECGGPAVAIPGGRGTLALPDALADRGRGPGQPGQPEHSRSGHGRSGHGHGRRRGGEERGLGDRLAG